MYLMCPYSDAPPLMAVLFTLIFCKSGQCPKREVYERTPPWVFHNLKLAMCNINRRKQSFTFMIHRLAVDFQNGPRDTYRPFLCKLNTILLGGSKFVPPQKVFLINSIRLNIPKTLLDMSWKSILQIICNISTTSIWNSP